MARWTGSWLSGPESVLPDSTQAYRGERLGLAADGPGSLAGTGRRVLALLADWFISVGIAAVLAGPLNASASTMTLLVWALIGIVSVTLFSFTPGQFFLGMYVARVDAPVRVGVWRAVVRQLLLCFLVPALFTDGDGRGMHDRATGTALIRR